MATTQQNTAMNQDALISCHGKTVFPSKAEASQHQERLSKRMAYHGKVQPYRCRHCGEWHVGNGMRPKRKSHKSAQ